MSRWTELRRALARVVATDETHSQVSEALTVALAVRGRTADDADLRLLVEATVVPDDARAGVDLERVAHALVLPATRRWLAGHDLDQLTDALAGAPAELESVVEPEFEALGARLLRLDIVAVEHLLASPSGDDAEPPGRSA